MNISGIYQIQSKIHPDRIYIGSAVDIKKRWTVHLANLRHNKHYSIKLQRHFIKYGEPDLQFSILCTCERNQLLQIEQYFLDFYHPYFNTCKIAGSQFGRRWKLSNESKNNIRLGHIGLTTVWSQKPVFQFNKQGVFIKEWVSIAEAIKSLCLPITSKSDIGKCCQGIRKSAYGFIWRYKFNAVKVA